MTPIVQPWAQRSQSLGDFLGIATGIAPVTPALWEVSAGADCADGCCCGWYLKGISSREYMVGLAFNVAIHRLKDLLLFWNTIRGNPLVRQTHNWKVIDMKDWTSGVWGLNRGLACFSRPHLLKSWLGNASYQWRFLGGKIIDKSKIFQIAMFDGLEGNRSKSPLALVHIISGDLSLARLLVRESKEIQGSVGYRLIEPPAPLTSCQFFKTLSTPQLPSRSLGFPGAPKKRRPVVSGQWMPWWWFDSTWGSHGISSWWR